MKHLKFPGLCLLFMFCSAVIAAQNKLPVNEPNYSKPKLFTNLPDQVPVDITELKTLITGNATAGKEVQLRSSDSRITSFKGKIVSAASKYNYKMQSVVIRSTEFNGATLTLSSSVQPDGTITYTGRIISFQHGDLYVLEKQNDNYILVKKNYYDLVNE
ncbi:MAG: hypothetical protein WDN26_17105 [Chitinophagaceae bacterium]